MTCGHALYQLGNLEESYLISLNLHVVNGNTGMDDN